MGVGLRRRVIVGSLDVSYDKSQTNFRCNHEFDHLRIYR